VCVGNLDGWISADEAAQQRFDGAAIRSAGRDRTRQSVSQSDYPSPRTIGPTSYTHTHIDRQRLWRAHANYRASGGRRPCDVRLGARAAWESKRKGRGNMCGPRRLVASLMRDNTTAARARHACVHRTERVRKGGMTWREEDHGAEGAAHAQWPRPAMTEARPAQLCAAAGACGQQARPRVSARCALVGR